LHHRQGHEFQRINAKLAARIRRLRKQQHWTIEKASEEFQIEPSHVKRLEAGSANPTLALLVSIATAFDLSLLELLGGSE